MTRYCISCGKSIADGDTHKMAKLCSACREKRSPQPLMVAQYGAHVITYLDEHGWPQYAHGKTLLKRYPDILSVFDIPTVRRKETILSVCLREIHSNTGKHYVPYSQAPSGHIRNFILVDQTTEQKTIEGVTA